MSLGDNTRQICRIVRELSAQDGGHIPVETVKLQSGLSTAEWDSCLDAAIQLNHLVMNEDGTLSEGSLMADQPDPKDFPTTPIVRIDLGAQPVWERIWLAITATALIAFVMLLVWNKAEFTVETWKLSRVLASLLAATVGNFLTGMLEVKGERPGLVVRGTGAFGAFVLVFLAL